MNDNTVFEGTTGGVASVPPPSEAGSPPSSIPPSTPTIVAAPAAYIAQPTDTPGEVADISDDDSFFSRFPIKTIIKIVIGIVVILGMLAALIFFVIPTFFHGKPEKVTLTYWGLWEDERVMQPVIAGFERENPLITVTYVKQDVKQYRDRLVTRVKNGTGPDIFRFHNTWLPELAGVIAPLSIDAIKPEDFKKWYYPVIQSDLSSNGAIYGIPLSIDTLALFVNTDAFEAGSASVPSTWEDFNTVSRSLTVKDENGNIKNAGAAIGTYDNINHAPDLISVLFAQNGSDPHALKNSEKTVAAIDFYTSFALGESAVWQPTLDPSELAFSKGTTAMYFGYSWDIFELKTLNPDLKFKIYPVPHLKGRTMSIASYWVEGVSQKSTHQKEAMLFMNYLTRKETEQKLFTEQSKTRLFGEPYARVDLADSVKDNELVAPFLLQAKDAVSSPFVSDTYDEGLNTKLNTYLGNAIRSVFSNTSPDTAVETLVQGVDQVMGDYAQQ